MLALPGATIHPFDIHSTQCYYEGCLHQQYHILHILNGITVLILTIAQNVIQPPNRSNKAERFLTRGGRFSEAEPAGGRRGGSESRRSKTETRRRG